MKPGLVVLAVLTFSDQYMSFLWPLVATNADEIAGASPSGLATQRKRWQVNYGVCSAGAVMALIPIAIFFLLLQRYFLAARSPGR